MLGKYTALDLYDVSALLAPEERAVQESVRKWVSDRYLPILPEFYRHDKFPSELIPEIAEMGLLGSSLPETYGCAGMNSVSTGIIMQELERGDSGLRSFCSVQSSLVMYPIFEFGSEEQRRKWLPALASAKAIGCFGLTEPDFGSNPGGMITHAVDDGDSYILNGAKMWITNGTVADVAVVWAKLKEGGQDVIRGFLVEKGTKGYSAPEIKNKFSLRSSVTSELIFQDCRIPKSNLLPKSKGLKSPLMCLTSARYGIAWGVIGAAQACFDEALNYTKTRIQFSGKPIASHQLVQRKLAEMATEITKAQLLALQLGRMKDEGKSTFVHVSLAKRNNVHMALETARTCRDMLGANGITDEYQVGRHMCNLESVITYEGTHDIHTLVLGEHLTGIPAYE